METILNTPLRFDRWEVPNRVVLQPMEGCDCGEDGSPGELTREKYLRAARSGAGIIWMEACAVCPEGRTNPGQLMLTEKNLPQFKALLTDMRQASRAAWGGSPLLLCQLTHSGRQSITPMIAYRHPFMRRPGRSLMKTSSPTNTWISSPENTPPRPVWRWRPALTGWT